MIKTQVRTKTQAPPRRIAQKKKLEPPSRNQGRAGEYDDEPTKKLLPVPETGAPVRPATPGEPPPGLLPFPKRPASKTTFDVFCAFWDKTLSQIQREHARWYIYRTWPVLIPEQVKDRFGKTGFQNPNCGKFSHLDPPPSLEFIRKTLGFGTYYIRFNQEAVKPFGTMFTAELEIAPVWEEFDRWPVLDVETIDQSHPSNAEYVKRLKARGILKTSEATEEEERMAEQNNETLTRTVDKLTDKVINMATTQGATPRATGDGEAAVSVQLVGLLKDQLQTQRPPQEQGTVLEHLTGLTNLAKELLPTPPNNDALVNALKETNATIIEMQNKQLERAERDAAEARQQAAEARRAIPAPKTLVEQLHELEEVEAVRARLRGTKEGAAGDANGEAAAPARGFFGVLPSILDTTKTIFALGANMLYNYTLAKTGKALDPATGAASSEPAAPDVTAALSPEEQENQRIMQSYFDHLTRIAPFLLNHVQQGKTGADFAQFVIAASNTQTFLEIAGAGRETLMELIQQYPPLWDQVKLTPVPFDKFIREFIAYKPEPPSAGRTN